MCRRESGLCDTSLLRLHENGFSGSINSLLLNVLNLLENNMYFLLVKTESCHIKFIVYIVFISHIFLFFWYKLWKRYVKISFMMVFLQISPLLPYNVLGYVSYTHKFRIVIISWWIELFTIVMTFFVSSNNFWDNLIFLILI